MLKSLLFGLLVLSGGMPYSSALFDVREFGAVGDGTTLDTPAIQRAIEAASAAGGGTVHLGAGNYLSTTIRLKSNLTLDLDAGATLIAATPSVNVRYDEPEPNAADKYQDFGHSHWHNGLIVGDGVHDVAIVGHGQIWGKGLERDVSKVAGSGDKAISLKLCRNVTLRDVKIRHGGWFAILATGVDNLTIDNLQIDTNRDGMDIDACRNVHVSNCTVNSPTDDAICLKSSYGLGFARATENVTISNCIVSGYREGTVLDGTFQVLPGNPTGRIKCGTESNGGFKNIAISNCVFDHCRGLNLSTVDGGALEDITIDNIVMRHIGNAPIFLRVGARNRGPVGTQPGTFRRVSLRNITVYQSASPSLISGLAGHPIEDLKLSDIRIFSQGKGTEKDARVVPPELEDGYPAPEAFGTLPASGFYLRHVRSVDLSQIEIKPLAEDARPAFVLADVSGASFFRISASRSGPLLTASATHNLQIRLCDGLRDVDRPKEASGRY